VIGFLGIWCIVEWIIDVVLSVGPPTLTHRLQLSPVAATGYSHPAKCLLAVRHSRVALAGPMGCFDDSDQLARDCFTSRTQIQEFSRRPGFARDL